MNSSTMNELVDRGEKLWQTWCRSATAEGLSVPDDAALIRTLKRVWEGSDYVAQSCLRDPGLLVTLLASGDLYSAYPAGRVVQQLQQALDGVTDEAVLAKKLRQFRRYQMVRIIWRDLARLAPLQETLEDLSALADACIDQALIRLYDWACAEQGIPRDKAGMQQRLVVLGMGKLGARELNLSSDIDLIFTFPSHGEVEGARRPLSNEQFFLRLCQRLVQSLNQQDADGFVFRVDVRLRPFGDSGPLVMSFAAMEDYYQTQAREWERYAMIKARVVAGDREIGAELMAMLKPFVYRRYLDFGVIESIRDMKGLISQELKRKGLADNIKLGPGGIREIEFIGQAFQLVRGGRDPELQTRSILAVLRLLGERDLLPPFVVRELSEAYGFLRLAENRLQAWQDQQTHSLPEDEPGRLRLARSMDFADWESFYTELERHRQRVQAQFDQVFAAPQTETEAEQLALIALWQGQMEAEEAHEILAGIGFHHPAESLERLRQLHGSHACRALGARGRTRLDQLIPLLLEAIGQTGEPDQLLGRLTPLIEAIARRTAYIALLVERPLALSQLVRLSAQSLWISRQLTRHPVLLDELLDPRRLYEPLHREALEQELDNLLAPLAVDDLEQQMESLRQFAQSNKLRVAAADVTGVIPLMVVSDYLTEIAEVVTARVLRLTWDKLLLTHGRPADLQGKDTGFAVIGYGKLGGVELGYGSDLDLVFLHGSQNPNGMTDGSRPIGNDVFYIRLGQRMVQMFTTRTSSGMLYEADMRLRPNGNSGMLVCSLKAFESYQQEEAWIWEHQALLRARPVAGDKKVIDEFRRIRQQVLSRQRDPEQLRLEVVEMREKMRQSLDKTVAGQFDLKQGVGGIADIEFMVQYAVLRWAFQYPDLLEWTDNIRLLEGLSRHRLMAGEAAEQLADAYRVLRTASHRKSLQDAPALVADDELAEERNLVRSVWRTLMAPCRD
ncbi:MAG: bifunctional [glutamate--ammonia ligase]-adenylyl-L-tyrosine phosphorylase/[glutamate--ammonia-ligase] adenylyltransferase [Candidatus Polarisedimenticolaceae bacterium]|nr:bifunctional [glutamate--ammonia ligase]-adenylyl-L-tyrosine phosphorylase/[glutamate--ammonia-ligase] adenylyltransferase [Candidatus Polarisedimenticolaceae bacterium]